MSCKKFLLAELTFFHKSQFSGASQVALIVKNTPASEGGIRDTGSTPGSGRSGGGRGNPPQYSCLENPMDRRDWRTIAYRVAKRRT